MKSNRGASPSSTAGFYDTHASEYCQSTADLDFRSVRVRFLKELRLGAHILDAGCGSGRDTKAFRDKGFRVTSIDASVEVARWASTFTGHPCHILSFQEMEFREEFDGVWVCASLLHVPKSDMNDVMARFIQALKPGGIMYISLKEGEGERTIADGRFFSYYTSASFRKLLRQLPELCEIAFWITEEIRSQTRKESWLNFLLRKNCE